MPNPLPDKAQRLVLGAIVVALVAFGIYLSVGGFGNGRGDQRAGQENGVSPSREEGNVGSPEPIPTADTKDMNVFGWLPFNENEIKTAAVIAQRFSEAYGTLDYRRSQESYYKPMQNLAANEFSKTLEKSSGATAIWDEQAKKKTVSKGRANVNSIRSFDDKSITFVVQTQAIIEDSDGAIEELGAFAVTVIKEGSDWKVYDFQPADAANLGDG